MGAARDSAEISAFARLRPIPRYVPAFPPGCAARLTASFSKPYKGSPEFLARQQTSTWRFMLGYLLRGLYWEDLLPVLLRHAPDSGWASWMGLRDGL